MSIAQPEVAVGGPPATEENHYLRLLHKEWNRGNPLACNFEITFRCNLKCEFCYNVLDPHARELTTPQILDTLRKLSEFGVLYCALSGGEPMVHPDFWVIADAVNKQGMALRLYTNACYIDEAAADRLRSEVRPLEVEISIHGSTPEVHDRLTGIRGSFDKAVHAVRLLRDRRVKVVLKTPLTRTNQHQIWEIHRLARELEASCTFDPVITPRDDGDLDPLRLQATPDFLRRFWSEEWKELRGGHSVVPMDHDSVSSNCGTGRTTIAIDPYGNIFPCVQWRRKAGNVLELERLSELWRDSPVLQEVRRLSEEVTRTTLKSCETGGFCTFCLGVAEVQTGSPVKMYPQALANARAKSESFAELVRQGRIDPDAKSSEVCGLAE